MWWLLDGLWPLMNKDEFAALVEAKQHNQLPRTTGLWLTSDGYFGRPLALDLTDILCGTNDPPTAEDYQHFSRQFSSLAARVALLAFPEEFDA